MNIKNQYINDKAQFMLTSDSISYGHISCRLNESAYIKVMTALTS